MRAVSRMVLCSGVEKVVGFVYVIAMLDRGEFGILFVLIPPCVSHKNNKMD